jgi:antitoxin YefM
MEPVPATKLRSALSKMLDKVNDDQAPVLITRRRGKPAVLMSLEEYEGMSETLHLLSTPANAARLAEAHEQIEKEIARRARRRRR